MAEGGQEPGVQGQGNERLRSLLHNCLLTFSYRAYNFTITVIYRAAFLESLSQVQGGFLRSASACGKIHMSYPKPYCVASRPF